MSDELDIKLFAPPILLPPVPDAPKKVVCQYIRDDFADPDAIWKIKIPKVPFRITEERDYWASDAHKYFPCTSGPPNAFVPHYSPEPNESDEELPGLDESPGNISNGKGDRLPKPEFRRTPAGKVASKLKSKEKNRYRVLLLRACIECDSKCQCKILKIKCKCHCFCNVDKNKKSSGVVMKASSSGPSPIQPAPKKKVLPSAARRVQEKADHVEMLVAEDADDRFECPFCKKKISPVHFHRHVKSKCVKAQVTISVVGK